jgi:protein-S-isoprenylcysteine O-methyltransferase Ste14
MQPNSQTNPGIRVIPPIIFLVALGVAFLADWMWPIQLLPDAVRYTLGPALVTASFAVMPWVLGAFKRAQTPFNTRRAAVSLVRDGPFRYSRNPGYLAMSVLCVGIAVLTSNVWIPFALVAALAFLHRHVILAEERHLEALFSDDYRAYKGHVRRWL